MSVKELRKKIKKDVDVIPEDRLQSLSEYMASLKRPSIKQQIEEGRADEREGRTVNWRDVRDDV